MKRFFVGLVALTSMLCAGPRSMAAITVDGSLASDWGVTVVTGATGVNTIKDGGSTYNPLGATGTIIGYEHEDTDDIRTDAYTVGPNQGGQNYDAEFLGVGKEGGLIYLAIMSGQRPDNGASKYAPGDIYILMDNGNVYGIEVGGGTATTSQSGTAQTEGAPGMTYKLDSSGNTIGSRDSNGNTSGTSPPSFNSAQVAGSIWLTTASEWILDPINGGSGPAEFNGKIPTQLNIAAGADPSKHVGDANYIFTRNDNLYGDPGYDAPGWPVSYRYEHSVIELSFAANLLDGVIAEVRWSPSCGNDIIWSNPTSTPDGGSPVPEPASIAVWSLIALGGIVGFRRRLRA